MVEVQWLRSWVCVITLSCCMTLAGIRHATRNTNLAGVLTRQQRPRLEWAASELGRTRALPAGATGVGNTTRHSAGRAATQSVAPLDMAGPAQPAAGGRMHDVACADAGVEEAGRLPPWVGNPLASSLGKIAGVKGAHKLGYGRLKRVPLHTLAATTHHAGGGSVCQAGQLLRALAAAAATSTAAPRACSKMNVLVFGGSMTWYVRCRATHMHRDDVVACHGASCRASCKRVHPWMPPARSSRSSASTGALSEAMHVRESPTHVSIGSTCCCNLASRAQAWCLRRRGRRL